ncbi:MAG: hypothetical protein ACYTF6_00560 [Planctomycetota bacterium]|jgi:tetratricopeptide (TPR) repeat protein
MSREEKALDGSAPSEKRARGGGRGYWQLAAVVMLAAAAASAGLTHIWNFDIHWHLASGEWMLRNFRVLGHDPFSIDPGRQWVNVHWLFQVVAALLSRIGGFELLSVAKAALAVAMVLTFALALRRCVSPAWLVFCGLGLVVVAAGRIRARPETFTLVFLMLTIVVLESVRRGASANRLWWLVPVMLIWVNMHGLFILGLGVIWAAVLGAWLDKKLKRPLAGRLATRQVLAPLLSATVACIVTPWPYQVITHPLVLWGRVSGGAFYYTYGVGELRPTWQALGAHKEAMVFIAMVVVAVAVNWRETPIAHAVWLAAFIGIAMLALRNVALAAPVCGFLLAWHGQAIIRGLAGRWRRLARAGAYLAALMIVLAGCVTFGYATELTYRLLNSHMRFGAGLISGNQTVDLAEWLSKKKVRGDVFCDNFGDSSIFIRYFAAGRNEPRRLVFMDGRLEVHSLERFIEQNNIRQQMRTVTLAEKVEMPETVRFVIVRYDSAEKLTALSGCQRFRLVRIGKVGVCFEDDKWRQRLPLDERAAQELPAANIDEFDKPLLAGGLMRGSKTPKRRWYRQNPNSLNYQIGMMLLYLGQEGERGLCEKLNPQRQRYTLLSIRYLTAALAEGIAPARRVRGALAQAHQQRMVQCEFVFSRPLPVEIHSARALYLYRLLDLSDLEDPHMLMYALLHVRGLLQARQFDAADQAVKDIMDSLPPPQRVSPPRSYLDLRGTVVKQLDTVQTLLAERDPLFFAGEQTDPLRRAKQLAELDIGKINGAIGELVNCPYPDGPKLLFLGDLLLRTGRVREARSAYGRAAAMLPAERQWEVSMRRNICDWVEGKAIAAAEALGRLAETTDQPVVRYYQALADHYAGRYEQTNTALDELGKLAKAAEHTKARYYYALALQNLGRAEEALEVFKSMQAEGAEPKELIALAIQRLKK